MTKKTIAEQVYVYCVENEISDLGSDMVGAFVDLVELIYPDYGSQLADHRFPKLCTNIMNSLWNSKKGRELFKRNGHIYSTTYANGHASNHYLRNVMIIKSMNVLTHEADENEDIYGDKD
ncbi:MAG: hypothetical protein ABF991_00395 [Liquorilactobacillus hordei]|uniref:hypothetical protein n=1 Tax=Liquorilactobacillus hordei TaxID=468911 RepID=UPI0039E7AAA4